MQRKTTPNIKKGEMTWEVILSNREYRVEAGRQSLLNFIIIYLSDFVRYPFAPFHTDLEADLYDDAQKRVACLMFRESAKTFFVSLAYALWCICYNKRNFILFGSDDQNASTSIMANLVRQLQDNELITNDFGVLYFEKTGGYSSSKKKSVKDFITANDVRCMARGVGQKVRGYTHNRHRPDLFIGDDLEGSKSVTTKEMRDKADLWLHSEVLPALNQVRGKAVISGNMLHRDCLMARLEAKSDVWKMHKVSLVNDDGVIAWGSRFVNTEAEAIELNKTLPLDMQVISIDEVRRDKGSHIFNQEYLLRPLSDEDQIIFPDHLKWYDEDINFLDRHRYRVVMAVDPAISLKDKADFSACSVWALEKKTNKLFCLDFFNEKLSFQQLKERIYRMYQYYQPEGCIVESVQAQEWLVQDLRDDYQMIVYSMKRKADKRSRLVSISHIFEQERVHFRRNQQKIIDQIIDFGIANHDDLVDTVIDSIQELISTKKTRVFKNKGVL